MTLSVADSPSLFYLHPLFLLFYGFPPNYVIPCEELVSDLSPAHVSVLSSTPYFQLPTCLYRYIKLIISKTVQGGFFVFVF